MIILIIILITILFAWACCVVAKRADQRIEKMMEEERWSKD